MKSRYVCTWSANVGDINRNKLRFGYSGMRFQIRVSIQGSGTRISGYPLRSLLFILIDLETDRPLQEIQLPACLLVLQACRLQFPACLFEFRACWL